MTGGRTLCAALAAGALAAAFLAPPAVGGGEPAELRGAVFAFSGVAGKARATGKGRLDNKAPGGGSGSIQIRAGNRVLVARVTRFLLRVEGLQTTLRLGLAVVGSGSSADCPPGALGVATLVEVAGAPEAGKIDIGFSRGRCRSFVRSWRPTRLRIEPLSGTAGREGAERAVRTLL